MNKLFLALESFDYRAMIAPLDAHFQRADTDKEIAKMEPSYQSLWYPGRPTVVYVGDVPSLAMTLSASVTPI